MPLLKRAGSNRELERLIALYLQAETDIINEIAALRAKGNVDYHAVAALERVQAILRGLESDCWTYVPKMIEREFYVLHPEARRIQEPVSKHIAAYANARALTAEQTAVAQQLVMNLMGELTEANMTAMESAQRAVLGRVEADIYRRVGLEQVAAAEAVGRGFRAAAPDFVEALRREGVTAFIDKAGRHWSLHTYGSMVLRTTSRQAQVMASLTRLPEHDLYRISSHDTGCALCAPYEGRVYSKSGAHPIFPPLAAAFGKRDPDGPDTLENTWLNIHPNCLHSIYPWTPAGKSEEQLREIERFSNPKTNPFTRDPRSEKQIEAYRKKEEGRRHWLARYRQWERYRETLGDQVPRTFETFQKHKLADDKKYKAWEQAYRGAKQLEKYSRVRYHEDGTVVATDIWTKHRSIPSTYRPNAVVETQFPGRQVDRVFYDGDGKMTMQVHSSDHGFPKRHPFGQHGEHQHSVIWDGDHMTVQNGENLEEKVRYENRDIL